MSHRPQMQLSSRIVIGLAIVAIGVILLFGNLGWVDARSFIGALWPLVLVLVGVAMLRDRRQRRGSPWPWVLITGGIWMFADGMGWVAFNVWDLLLPAFLLFIGMKLLYRPSGASCGKHGPGADESSSGESSAESVPPSIEHVRRAAADKSPEFVRTFAFMSYCDLRPVARPLRGGDLSAVMGGIKLDLRDMGMEGDEVVIEVFAFWAASRSWCRPIGSSRTT
jgi:Predicted membrane protein (DUF2154).